MKATAVNATFYFDFADVRSYLAAMQLPALLDALPVRLDLVPVSANALAASVGAPAHNQDPAVRRYAQVDATRWARHHHVPLSWPAAPLTSGPALRVVMWLLQHQPDKALDAVLEIFRRVWQHGQALSEDVVRDALEQLDIDARRALQHAARNAAFAAFEATIEIAVADGIFEIPTLRVGAGDDFVGFDRIGLVTHSVIEHLVRRAEPERVIALCADLLVDTPPARRQALLESLGETRRPLEVEPDEPRNPRFDALAAIIRTLPTLDASARLPVPPPAGPLQLAIVPTRESARTLSGTTELKDLLADESEHGVVVGPNPLIVSNVAALGAELEATGLGTTTGGMLMPVIADGHEKLLHLSPSRDADAFAHVRPCRSGLGQDGEMVAHVLSTGRAGMLTGWLARNAPAQRKLASVGAHVLCLAGVAAGDPRAVAAAVRCQRWVVTLGDTIGVHDREGRFVVHPLVAGEPSVHLSLSWPPVHPDDSQATAWSVEAPRTILIHERPLTLGPPDSGADLTLRVSGTGLTVSGGGQGSTTLSPTQPFSAIRHGFATLHVVPIHGDQLLAAEMLAAKMLDGLARRRRNARILLVSYWPDLSYDDLTRLRPVMAATSIEHDAPLLVVTGNRLVELWQCDTQHQPFRVEADGEVFPLDLAQQPTMQARRDHLIEEVEAPEALLAMLRRLRA